MKKQLLTSASIILLTFFSFTTFAQRNAGGSSNGIPQQQSLTNYPNAFSKTTTLKYEVPVDGVVAIKIYNMSGQQISTVVNGTVNGGTHEVEYTAPNLPNGIYICNYSFVSGTNKGTVNHKLVVIN